MLSIANILVPQLHNTVPGFGVCAKVLDPAVGWEYIQRSAIEASLISRAVCTDSVREMFPLLGAGAARGNVFITAITGIRGALSSVSVMGGGYTVCCRCYNIGGACIQFECDIYDITCRVKDIP